jgi:hypothetical protein
MSIDVTRFRRLKSTSSLKLLERKRAHLIKITVPAHSIVKTLYVNKHVWLGFLARSIDATFDYSPFQIAEKRLSNSIVPAVPTATHAW